MQSTRAARRSDRAAFLDLTRASRRLHRGWVAPPADATSFAALLGRSRTPTHASLLVCERASESVAGVFNVSQIFLGNFRSAYLGYYAHAGFAGRGLPRAIHSLGAGSRETPRRVF